MLSKDDLIYLGACIIYGGGRQYSDAAILTAKDMYEKVFESDKDKKDNQMILE